ncbi:MAG TPA: TetR family transcriptional regulator, partial [Elusimicrobia bacterium]|nr:TetR family transcriptional regulator [Elusimicrobiota bacterium]
MEKSEEKKNIILQISGGIFSRFGLFKTTVDEIAKAAHIGKSSIYYYFKSKEGIFKEVIAKEGKMLEEKIATAINEAKSPQEKMKAFVYTRMKCLKELANIYSALKDEYLKHYSFVQKLRQDYDRKEISIVKTILKEGIEKKIFKIEDLELTSFTIVTALRGMEYEWAIKT